MDEKDVYKLIDDSGIHEDNKRIQSLTFVIICRIFTVILIILGLGAIIVEFI